MEQSAAGGPVRAIAAGTKSPAFAAKIPEASEHYIRIVRIDYDNGASGRKIAAFEREFPIFAAVGCAIKPAIGRITP